MKRILCFLLCLMLCLSSAPMLSLATQENAEADAFALEIAIALGILDATSLSRASKTISRGEFTDALVRLTGVEIAAADVPFTDLSSTSEYYASICTAYALGYINGHTDGTFREAEPMTKSAAVRLLTYAIGWKELIDAGMHYADAAKSSELCQYGSAMDSAGLSVADAAQLLIVAGNAYTVQINNIQINKVGNTSLGYSFDDKTILERYRGIYLIKGVLDANEFTYLNTTDSLTEGMVKINGELLYIGETNAETLLGWHVTAYYTYSTAGDKKTLIYITETDNDMLFIQAEDYVDYTDGSFTYADEKGDIKNVRLTLSAIDAIYNEKLLTLPKKEHFEIDNGTITLIDNDLDGAYEVVKILCYETFVINSVDKDNQKVFAKWGGGVLDFMMPKKISFISEDGKKMHITELAEWDVLSVARSLDEEVVTVIYAIGWDEGEITSVTVGTPSFVTMNGKTYQLSDYFIDHQLAELRTGVKAMLLLDAGGKVAAANFDVPDGKDYAYIIKAGKTGSSIQPVVTMKYMDSDGKINIAEVAKTVVFNGQRLKTEDNISVLSALAEQLMICSINTDGCISYIDTAYTDRNGTITDLESGESTYRSLCKFYDGHDTDGLGAAEALTYKTATRVFGYKVPIAAETKVFVVPHTPGADDDYHVFSAITHFANDMPYTVQGYKSNPEHLHAEALIYKDSLSGTTIADDTPAAVVEKVVQALNEAGESAYKLSVYSNAVRYEYFTKEDSVYTDVTLDGSSYRVAPGDVVRLAVDANNRITKCEVVYSCSKDTMNGSNPNSNNQWATFRAMIAFVYQKYKNNFITTTTPVISGNNYELSSLANVETRAFSSYWQILVFDSQHEKLSVGSAEDVLGYINTGGAESSKVFVYDRRGDARIMVVYK